MNETVKKFGRKKQWREKTPDGKGLLCFKIKNHGEEVTYKYTLEEVAEFLEEKHKLKEVAQ